MNWGLQWPTETYPIIAADPPWDFRTYSKKGRGRNPDQHYPVMSRKDIADLPVSSLVQDRSTLLLWTTPQDMDYAQNVVMPAWGFQYKTDAFIWVKTRKDYEKAMKKAFKRWQKTGEMPDVLDLIASMFITTKGYYTRKQAEICLLGTTKKILPRSSKNVKELIVQPRREHSRKPDEFYPRVEQLYAEGEIIDLFARESHGPRWSVWGNETEKFDGEE